MSVRILVVEDDVILRQAIIDTLSGEWIAVGAASIASAREELEKQTVDLILMDLGLPDGDGVRFCAFLQNEERFRQTPVIILTGHTDIETKLTAFSSGAEDYMLKPFDSRELRARIRARLARREQTAQRENMMVRGNLKLSVQLQRAYVVGDGGEKEIDLTPIEFKLLHYFMKHENVVLTREQLLKAAWGDNTHVLDRTVDTHVSSLRRKLGPTSWSVKTRHGSGYFFTQGGPIKLVAKKAA